MLIFSSRCNGKSTKVNVSADPDINREDFEDKINNLETPKTPTSVYVAVPDEVQNDATYKANAITNAPTLRSQLMKNCELLGLMPILLTLILQLKLLILQGQCQLAQMVPV